MAEIEKPKTVALHIGSSVHSTLKAWNKARWRDQPLSTEELREQYLSAWQERDGFEHEPDDDEKKHERTGWSLVETYLRETTISLNEKPEAVEVPVEANLNGHGLPTLVGVLDLVQNGTIVDFKTSSSTPVPEKIVHLNEIQTSGYGILYREATGRSEKGIEIHTLVKLKTPKLVITTMSPVTGQQVSRLFHLMESYVDGLAARDWVPSPGLQCSCCEYFAECRKWS